MEIGGSKMTAWIATNTLQWELMGWALEQTLGVTLGLLVIRISLDVIITGWTRVIQRVFPLKRGQTRDV